jgi:uncharacterized membrane protein
VRRARTAEPTHLPARVATPEPIETVQAPKPPRFVALDLLRFLAVFLMVQGHTFFALLEPAVKSQKWYMWHGYVHGYTAPIFFFSSGLAFGITTLRTWKQHLGWTRAVRKRFERYGILLIVGYGMHASALSLSRMLSMSREELMPILQFDTLQNIAVFLFVTELLVIGLRRPKLVAAAMALIGTVIVIAAPWLWRMDVAEWPVGIAAMVNESTGSIFPIAPWSGFIAAGVITAHLLWNEEARRFREKPYIMLGIGGAAITLLSFALTRTGYAPWGEHNFWKTSPYFFLTRIGVIWIVLGLFSAMEHAYEGVRSSTLSIGIQRLGQETLVVYVAHLLVLYGTPWTPSLHETFAESLTLGQSTLVFSILFAAMVVLALLWREWKTRFPVGFDRTRWTITALFVIGFLLGPGAP